MTNIQQQSVREAVADVIDSTQWALLSADTLGQQIASKLAAAGLLRTVEILVAVYEVQQNDLLVLNFAETGQHVVAVDEVREQEDGDFSIYGHKPGSAGLTGHVMTVPANMLVRKLVE